MPSNISMDVNQVKGFIREMFPDVDDEDVDYLIRTNSNVDTIVAKILTNEYKEFKISLKELVVRPSQPMAWGTSLELYYPEIFDNTFIDEHVHIQEIRKQAHVLYEKAEEHSRKRITYKTRQATDYYTEEVENLISKAKALNRRAALVIIKKSIRNPNLIDLHGLYVQEALMFLSDFINKVKPRRFGVITGQEKAEGTLRPSVISLLRKRSYTVVEEGPCLYAKKALP